MADQLPDLSTIQVTNDSKQEGNKPNIVVDGGDFDIFEEIDKLEIEPVKQVQGGTENESQPAKCEEDKKAEFNERLILQLYNSYFPTNLAALSSELTPQALEAKNLTQLKELRGKCDLLLGSGSQILVKKKMFNACIFGIEQVTTKFLNYNTTGLTKELLMDKDFQKDIL